MIDIFGRIRTTLPSKNKWSNPKRVTPGWMKSGRTGKLPLVLYFCILYRQRSMPGNSRSKPRLKQSLRFLHTLFRAATELRNKDRETPLGPGAAVFAGCTGEIGTCYIWYYALCWRLTPRRSRRYMIKQKPTKFLGYGTKSSHQFPLPQRLSWRQNTFI